MDIRPVCPNVGRTHFPGRVEVSSYRLGGWRHVFCRCAICEREWTLHQRVCDRSQQIDADEVLSVYEALKGFTGRLTELFDGGVR
jgi:hypothetical protein